MDRQLGFLVAISITIISLLFLVTKRTFSYWERMGIPSIKPTIPFGNFANPITNTKPEFFYLQQCYDQLKTLGTKFGGFYAYVAPAFLPIHPEYVKYILVKDFQTFQARGFNPSDDHPISINLFTTDGEKWSNLRSKFTPAFTSAKLKDMFELILTATEKMNKYVEDQVAKKFPLNVKDCTSRLTATMITSCAFGIDYDNFQDDAMISLLKEIVVESTSFIRFSIRMALPKLANFLNIPIIVTEQSRMICNTLEETVKYRTEKCVSRKDFLQLLIEMKNDGLINISELKAQSIIFLLAGFETSSITTSFLLYELAKDQEMQEKLRHEINQTLGKYDERKITYEAIMDMKYLDMVLCETLRMYPPVPVLLRKSIKEYKLPNTNVVLEKGTRIMVSVISLHYDPEFFPDPEVFNPDRFSEQNKQNIIPYSYIPFGGGPRNCIGGRLGKLQVKVGVVNLLRKCKIKLNASMKMPLEFGSTFALSTKTDILLDVELL